MDLLTHAVDALRLRRAHYRRDELGARVRASVENGSGLHIVESGHVRLTAGKLRVELAPGDVVLVPRPLQRTLAPPPRPSRLPARLLSGELEFSSPDHPLLPALPAVVHVPCALVQGNPEFGAQIASLAAELEHTQHGSQALIARITDILFIHVMRLSPPPAQAECPSGWLRGLHDPRLSPVLAAMHSAPGHAWTLQSLAKLAGQSRSAFAAHFAAGMGEPAMTYLARWRMFRARCLLREGDLPLAAIADQIGYGSSTAFSLAFAREHGSSPGAFRALARKGVAATAITYRPSAEPPGKSERLSSGR